MPTLQPHLSRASLLYLFFPYLLFAFGWLWLPYACLLTCAVGWGGYLAWRGFSASEGAPAWTRRDAMLLAAIAFMVLLWCLLSGMGGVGYQNLDYVKHNAVLKDLVSNHWPVVFDNVSLPDGGTGRAALVYYLAFYLPAAAAGKWLGWGAANFVLFLWGFLGAGLSVLWFMELVGKRAPWALLLFIFFSGLDFVGYFLGSGRLPGFTEHLEWWAMFCQYSSNTTLLYWVPQHAFCGWIVTALLLDESLRRKSSESVVFLTVGALLWSPFVLVGLVPFLAWGISRLPRKSLWTVQNAICAPCVAILAGLFFLSHSGAFPHGWIWESTKFPVHLLLLLLFYALEFGILAWLAWPLVDGEKELRGFGAAALAILVALPLYRVGEWHDLGMRASIPALFVLCVLIGRALERTKDRFLPRREALILLLALGGITPFHEIARALSAVRMRAPMSEATGSVLNQGIYAGQYLGAPDTFFFKHLAARP